MFVKKWKHKNTKRAHTLYTHASQQLNVNTKKKTKQIITRYCFQ